MSKERKKINAGAEERSETLKHQKKRKGGCLKKLLITLCITVGTLAVLIVGGLFVGDAVMRSQVGVSLFDVFGVIYDIGNYDLNEIVTNSYTDDDATGFYDAANSTLFFKTGDEAILDSAYVRSLLNEVTSGGDITASLLDMLDSDNFDTELLAAFTGWKDGSSVTANVTDRQFAAFLDDLIFSSGYIDSLLPDLDILGDASLDDLVTLVQIIVTNAESSDSVMMKLTMSLDINETINTVLPNLPDEVGIVKSMGWLFDFLLPDEIFVSATVDLSDASAGMELELNALSQETCSVTAREDILSKYDTDGDGQVTKMDRLFIIIESFSNIDIRQTINESASDVLSYICISDSSEFSLAGAIDLTGVTSSSSGTILSIDMYGMLAGALNELTGGSATASDIIVLMQALLCSNPTAYSNIDFLYRCDYYYDPADEQLTAALKECGFNSLSDVVALEDYEALCTAYGGEPYTEAGATLDGLESVYKAMFMDKLEKAYCLNFGDYTFKDIIALFGITASDSETSVELTDLIDGASLAEAASSDEARTLQITDRMLGAIIAELMSQFIGDDLSDCDITLRALRIEKETIGEVEHDLVTVTFTLDLTPLLGDSASYLSNILPQQLTLAVTADMTPGLADDDRLTAELTCFNDITSVGASLNELTTDYLLSVIKRIIPDIDLDSLLDEISSGMATISDNMADILPNFSFAVSGEGVGYAELPDVFTLAADMLGLSEGEEESVSGEDLKSVVNYLVNYNYEEDIIENADYIDFLMSVQKNYYIEPALTSFNSVFEELQKILDSPDLYTIYSLLRTEDRTYTYTRADETQEIEKFSGYKTGEIYNESAKLNETDLLAIINEKINDENSGFGSASEYAELINVKITENDIALDIRLAVSKLLGQYATVFNCEYIYVKLTIEVGNDSITNTDERTYYNTKIEINDEGTNDANYGIIMRILAKLGVEGFDLDEIAEDVGAATYEVFEMFSSVKLDYKLTDGEITFPSINEYIQLIVESFS